MLVWCDLETTGLNPNEDLILEIALVVTDDNLNELGHFQRLFHYGGPDDVANIRSECLPHVQKMHDDNGLWKELENTTAYDASFRSVQGAALAFLTAWDVPEKKVPLCGSTIAFDRSFLRGQALMLHDYFSHRNFDVSVFREAAERWNPEVFKNRPEGGGHRALSDIRMSIEAMRSINATVRQLVWCEPTLPRAMDHHEDLGTLGAPVMRHSAKPPEVRERIVRLMGDLPRIELFAREKTPGWDVFGNQVEDSVDITSLAM